MTEALRKHLKCRFCLVPRQLTPGWRKPELSHTYIALYYSIYSIKTSPHTHLFRHCYVHILWYWSHRLNGKINFKIRFAFGICKISYLTIKICLCFKYISLSVIRGLIIFTSLNDTFILLVTNTFNSVKKLSSWVCDKLYLFIETNSTHQNYSSSRICGPILKPLWHTYWLTVNCVRLSAAYGYNRHVYGYNRHVLTPTVRPSVRCVPNTQSSMPSQPSRTPNCNC